MAHFLEHMLFLGTEKYPKDDEYQKFISANGGSSNAYTSMEETVYYFDVLSSKLEPALDRFAQFFIAPLFTEDATNREMNAVNSENQKNLQVDSWRSFQLIKHLSNPAHRFNSFGSGNLEVRCFGHTPFFTFVFSFLLTIQFYFPLFRPFLPVLLPPASKCAKRC